MAGGEQTLLFCVVCFLTFGTFHAILEKKDFRDFKHHPCHRKCDEDGLPRRCEYDWTLEMYYSMSKACFNCPFNVSDCSRPHCVATEGTPRGILTANRILPGPEINVCEGDEVVVNVLNNMVNAAGTSIHWHGLLQKGSPHMDGVGLLTQCHIPQLAVFQYRFVAMDPGTHWWHSHSGLQRSNGLYGHLVVRQKASRDPNSALYDYDLAEHVVSVADWINEMSESRMVYHHHSNGKILPHTLLINGKGAHREFVHPDTGTKHYTPYAEFKVTAGKRYRFRVINAAMMYCPIQISVDNHTLIVIATDGGAFDPLVLDSFNIFPGERFDFVLTAHVNSSSSNHWIRARGFGNCKNAHQVAILHYEGAPATLPEANRSYEASIRLGRKLNPLNTKATDMLISVDRLESTEPDDDALKPTPDKKFYLAIDFEKIDNLHFNVPGLYPLSSVSLGFRLLSPQINHISLALPPVPMLTQFDQLDEKKQFCTPETMQVDCKTQYCECTYRLKVALGDVVEMIIIDEGVVYDANHPMHLHGFKFRVVGMDRLNKSTSLEEVRELDRQGKLNRKLTKAVLKDTVTIPDGGYTIIRFKADNPGVWIMHCHIEFHSIIGMGVIVQVGEPSQFPKTPKGFPKCGNFSPMDKPGKDHDDEKITKENHTCNMAAPNLSKSVAAFSIVVAQVFVRGHVFKYV